jgi:hypothetical protein
VTTDVEATVTDGEPLAPRPTIEIDGIECDLDKVKAAASNIVRALLHIQAFEIQMDPDEVQVETKALLDELKTILRGEYADAD